MRYAAENRFFISFLFAGSVGIAMFLRWPFPTDDPLLRMIWLQRPAIYAGIRAAYTVMMFTTPYMIAAFALSFTYIFAMKQERRRVAGKLPPYPSVEHRQALSVVIGEL